MMEFGLVSDNICFFDLVVILFNGVFMFNVGDFIRDIRRKRKIDFFWGR